jgi:hypothetical protein
VWYYSGAAPWRRCRGIQSGLYAASNTATWRAEWGSFGFQKQRQNVFWVAMLRLQAGWHWMLENKAQWSWRAEARCRPGVSLRELRWIEDVDHG